MKPAWTWAACAIAAAGMAGPAAAATDALPEYRNVTAGGTLRAGVYGRIVLKAKAAPPPLIYPDPQIGSGKLVPGGTRPVYLYVPPGQVRKWKQSCTKWSACDEPVLFIRMEDSPSRWGHWRLRRDQVALQERG
jgi:hypothetical protein